ncbi:hypothetical protein GF354_05735 [Candidatus Peregrinibacteria bacterium]|nr:hypothetical protein [Candidatus Peregrinibacteria bacterium]
MNGYKSIIIILCFFFVGLLNSQFLLDGALFEIFVLDVMGFYFLFRVFGAGLRVMLLALLGILIGMARLFFSFGADDNFVVNFLGEREVEGCIKEVDVRVDKVKYTISLERMREGEEWREINGLLLVNGERYPVYKFGHCLNLQGEILIPHMIDTFNYGGYLSRFNIFAVMYFAEIRKVSGENGNKLMKFLFELKSVFEGQLEKLYLEPENSFMAGLLLGSRRGIPDHLMENFNITGLTHIIAISGYNITIIIVIIGNIFSFLSRKIRIIVSSIFIILFVILVGANAAVVRAGIMGVIGLLALWSGRNYLAPLALLWACFFMNFWNPRILLYDVGFQLSVLATGGLIFVSPRIEKYFTFLPKFLEIRESILMTLSAQILALPIILMNFGRLSLISPIANLFVLPMLPFTMFFGFLGVMGAFVYQKLGLLFAYIGYVFLKLIVFLVEKFALIPLASLDINFFSKWVLVFYYFLILDWLLKDLGSF